MKSLMLLLQAVLADAGTRCRTSTDLDFKRVQARVEAEGLSFLTITLANFGKDLQKALDQGFVTHDQFKGFAFSGGLPRFLGGFLELIFARESGRLVDNPSIDAIQAVRQITLLFSKIEIPCSDVRNRRAIERYIDCEREVRQNDRILDRSLRDSYLRIHHSVWSAAYSDLDRKVWNQELLPKHGGGATADRMMGNQKFYQREWPIRANSVFPFERHLFPNMHHASLEYHIDALDASNDVTNVIFLEPGQERPVKVTLVPKTLKTPRIIAEEPTCMQYMQQGVMEAMYERIEGDRLLSNFIKFTDQIPNQEMAREGSLTGELATLDLSEASDRVSNQLVRAMFARFPHIAEAIDASRSRKADVPGHGVIRLAKFASMGSALCFPIEAMVFLNIVLLGISRVLNRRLTNKDLWSLVGRVRVYGDDIVVPVEYVHSVVECLEAFGFKVNSDKSFWTGKFRESCGKEYFAGEDVSIVKCKQLIPSSRRDVTEVESLVSFRNHLYKSGYWGTVRHLDHLLNDLFGGHYPAVGEDSSVLGKHTFLSLDEEVWCVKRQIPLVRGYVTRTRIRKNSLDGSGALLKYFLKRGNEPIADREHLERSGRPEAVDIKLRWTPQR